MNEKKYIDRLYQEKFKDFEAVPEEVVWKSISAKLQKEKRRRAIAPVWYRIAGVAAVLSLVFLLGDWFTTTTQPGLVNIEQIQNDVKEIISSENSENLVVSEDENLNNTSKSGALDDKEEITGRENSLPKGQQKNTSTTEKSITTLSAAKFKEIAPQVQVNPISLSEVEKGMGKTLVPNNTPLLESANDLQTEKELEKDEKKNKFEITTYAAPVFYGNMGEGNFIAPQFNNNESAGEVSYSYGVQLAYAISKNLKIRSGINKVSMSFNTHDVVYQSIIEPQAISSIDYPKQHLELTGRVGPKSKSNHSLRKNVETTPALLNQQLGYLEVPVTLEYNLINKRFQLNLVGGASTLFLEDNMVSVNTGSQTTKLGSANNLNQISFSTNIGLGLDYKLTDEFKFNLEPIFKYQINTFNSKLNNYQPYFMAIYTGISFEF